MEEILNTDIESIKLYLRIDDNNEDALLTELKRSAVEYLTFSGVLQSDLALYNLAIKMLVSHFYENRNIVTEKQMKNLPNGINSIILRLKFLGG